MKKFLKWSGVIVGGLLGLLAVVLGVVYVRSEERINKVYELQPEAVVIPTNVEAIAEGKRLFASRGCVDCHHANGAGGVFIDDSLLGHLSAANLTAGEGGVGSSYQDSDWVRSIRHGVGPDGKPLWIMPSHEYNGLDDRDLGAIIAYVKNLSPVNQQNEANTLGPLGRVLLVTDQIAVLPAERIDHTAPRPVAVEPGVTKEYGAYLAQTCTGCHGTGLSGGAIPGVPADPPYPANLTPEPTTGLGQWTEADFIRAIRTGQRPDGSTISQAMPWVNFSQMSDVELSALWLYLQSMPAKPAGQR